jgi:Putative mono-oxygenase ydhR
MYVRIVTFTVGISGDEYRALAESVAAGFTEWPGLLGKVWLGDRERNRYGGVYLFASKADADRSRSTPLFAALGANPALTDVAVEEFDTLPGATAVTWLGLRDSAAVG